MLEVLADGEIHDRHELIVAGVAACPAHYALSMYQRAASTDRARFKPVSFEGMSTEERLREITRQEITGAKILAGRIPRQLAERKFVEVVEQEMLRGRLCARKLRITDRGRLALQTGTTLVDPAEVRARSAATRRARYGEDADKKIAQKSLETRRANGDFSDAGRRSWETRRLHEDRARAETLVPGAETTAREQQRREQLLAQGLDAGAVNRAMSKRQRERVRRALRTKKPRSTAATFDAIDQAVNPVDDAAEG